eukprot:g9011.t1
MKEEEIVEKEEKTGQRTNEPTHQRNNEPAGQRNNEATNQRHSKATKRHPAEHSGALTHTQPLPPQTKKEKPQKKKKKKKKKKPSHSKKDIPSTYAKNKQASKGGQPRKKEREKGVEIKKREQTRKGEPNTNEKTHTSQPNNPQPYKLKKPTRQTSNPTGVQEREERKGEGENGRDKEQKHPTLTNPTRKTYEHKNQQANGETKGKRAKNGGPTAVKDLTAPQPTPGDRQRGRSSPKTKVEKPGEGDQGAKTSQYKGGTPPRGKRNGTPEHRGGEGSPPEAQGEPQAGPFPPARMTRTYTTNEFQEAK